MATKLIGTTRTFFYPQEFTTLPDYTAHRGVRVEVLRALRDGDEYDGPRAGLERMYEVRALGDGWIGHAWESELQ